MSEYSRGWKWHVYAMIAWGSRGITPCVLHLATRWMVIFIRLPLYPRKKVPGFHSGLAATRRGKLPQKIVFNSQACWSIIKSCLHTSWIQCTYPRILKNVNLITDLLKFCVRYFHWFVYDWRFKFFPERGIVSNVTVYPARRPRTSSVPLWEHHISHE
jgi:hypothetical protein